jgi:hypothetical protein
VRRACIICTVALCLAVCISVFSGVTEPVEIQAATGSFSVNTPTPTAPPVTPMPTATPTLPPVTPTPSPTPNATQIASPTPTTTSSGSSQPSISMKLSINMMGQETEWLRTTGGKVLEDITAANSDGTFTLRIHRDTFALDADGHPLTAISIIAVDPLVKSPLLIPPSGHYLIYAYEFLPEGASFSKPIELEINYDPSDLPKSPDELVLQMYVLNGAPYEWESLPGLSAPAINTIVCSINHLSTYALIAAPTEGPAPTLQPMPAPTPPATHNSILILLVLILPIASLMFFIYVLLRWHRRNDTYEDTNS